MGAPGSGDGPSPGPAKIDPKTVGKMLDWADKRDGKHPLGPNSGPAKMDPKNVDKILDWGDKAENVLDVLVPYVRTMGTQFLDQWLTQMNSARTDATPPAEESKDVWFIALAGNLLWAASCFVPGAGVIKGAADGMSGLGKIMYATMGHAGALVGAGAFERSQVDSSGVPTGKDLVPAALNGKRIELGKAFEKNIDSWVSKLLLRPGFHAGDYRDKGRNKYLEAVDQVLWYSLFP